MLDPKRIKKNAKTMFVSATPAQYEMDRSESVVEQIDQSILKPSLASAAVNLIGNSSFNLFPFVTTMRFAACGPTLMFVVASPSNTHLSSLWALLTVRRMT